MTEFIVPEGRHKSRPFRFSPSFCEYKPEKAIMVNQGESSKYIVRDSAGNMHVDQWDWLKVLGRQFHVNPHKNTYMLATRFNPIEDVFEYTSYFHVNGRVYVGTLFQNPGISFDLLKKAKKDLSKGKIETFAANQYKELVMFRRPIAVRKAGQPLFIDEITEHSLCRYGFRYKEEERLTVKPISRNWFSLKIYPWFGGTSKAPSDWKVVIHNW
jgi:hypothetical protein